MQKRHFELIAETLRGSYLWYVNGDAAYTQSIEFADALAGTNPLFDRSKFLWACRPAGMDASYRDLRDPELSNQAIREIIAA